MLALCTIFFGLGVVFWALGFGHAGWHLHKDMMYEQAEVIAQKISERNSDQNMNVKHIIEEGETV